MSGSNATAVLDGPSLKFTLAIGGIALVSFIVGLIVFETLRGATSLPIIIIFVGIALDPAGFTAALKIRSQLVIWMGGSYDRVRSLRA